MSDVIECCGVDRGKLGRDVMVEMCLDGDRDGVRGVGVVGDGIGDRRCRC